MIKLFIFIMIMIGFSIGCDSQLPKINYKEHFNLENKKFLQLKVFQTTVLEETEDYIIESISNAEVDDFGLNLLITDNNSNLVIIYDYNSGKIKHSFALTREYSDLFLVTDYDFGLWESVLKRKFLPNSIKEQRKLLKKQGLDTNQAGGLISNFVNIAKYYGDEIVISGYIYIMASSTDTLPKKNFLINHPCLIITDSSLVFKKMLPLRQNSNDYFLEGYSIPRANDFIYNKTNNSYYVTSKNEINSKNKVFNDLTTVNKYNADCSKYSIIANLPLEYIKTKIGYLYNWTPSLVSINNKLYCTYPLSDRVYDITDEQKEAFKLINIPYDNNEVIEYFSNNYLKQENGKEDLTMEQIFKLLPLTVWKTIPMVNNIGILLTSRINVEDANKSDYFFQEYTTDGKLAHFTRIPKENKNGKFKDVTFDKKNKFLLIFRKHKEKGWIMEKSKWE